MSKDNQQVPAWLIGLIAAAILVVVVLIVLSLFGFGDDPSLGTIR